MNLEFQKIIGKYKHYYFVSPHFDDAILSAGDLISYIAPKEDVIVINVFTKAGKRNTLSARRFLNYCGYVDAGKLFLDRDEEDKSIFSELKVKRINLEYTDALWRKRTENKLLGGLSKFIPEINAMYPTHKFHIAKGTIARGDMVLIDKISDNLKNIVNDKNSIIFCPFAGYNHVDHGIVRKACEKAFDKVIYWSDYPYFIQDNMINKVTKLNELIKYSFTANTTRKTELIRMYRTQFRLLFPDGIIPLKEENYYISQKI